MYVFFWWWKPYLKLSYAAVLVMGSHIHTMSSLRIMEKTLAASGADVVSVDHTIDLGEARRRSVDFHFVNYFVMHWFLFTDEKKINILIWIFIDSKNIKSSLFYLYFLSFFSLSLIRPWSREIIKCGFLNFDFWNCFVFRLFDSLIFQNKLWILIVLVHFMNQFGIIGSLTFFIKPLLVHSPGLCM